MTWADFWILIDTLNGEADEASCRRLAEELGSRPVPEIIGFADRHAEALYRLDQEKFGVLPVVNMTDRDGSPFPQSADHFLYTRCAVVAAGRAAWEDVFIDVDKFVPSRVGWCGRGRADHARSGRLWFQGWCVDGRAADRCSRHGGHGAGS
ncbi:DUF4240 domain-containing protein [Streptomyces sp900116325]|uniref:DUF4240 domain-containing protein n=1 Tax=Streptomyces sp. 900116325 TaxID=3154295 RepID=UPI00332824AD